VESPVQQPEEENLRFKFIVIGDSEVGKTSIINKFGNNSITREFVYLGTLATPPALVYIFEYFIIK
jgi:GTPase SAR1 family protein